MPHLLDIEVAQVIGRYAANGDIDSERGRLALSDLACLSIQRHSHDLLLLRIYDAAYVALAEVLDRPLLTRDKRLGRRRAFRTD